MKWLWQVHCMKCGYKSGWHNRFVAAIISILHTVLEHPHGFNVIGAAEAYRVSK